MSRCLGLMYVWRVVFDNTSQTSQLAVNAHQCSLLSFVSTGATPCICTKLSVICTSTLKKEVEWVSETSETLPNPHGRKTEGDNQNDNAALLTRWQHFAPLRTELSSGALCARRELHKDTKILRALCTPGRSKADERYHEEELSAEIREGFWV
jgi:hypothetical protein